MQEPGSQRWQITLQPERKKKSGGEHPYLQERKGQNTKTCWTGFRDKAARASALPGPNKGGTKKVGAQTPLQKDAPRSP